MRRPRLRQRLRERPQGVARVGDDVTARAPTVDARDGGVDLQHGGVAGRPVTAVSSNRVPTASTTVASRTTAALSSGR
ncbi:hypothetical protein BC477_00830 [Clavibacter michiganensis subsp. michiganensis]|uniref:Uncharacterized protein n=1 Tax=Clavibacter michiganensis subsp. michiganensis TaxID=33013 RepID=A0A251XEM9_CLAMM|nr:hypothetical protein BC477_00830 [Clavibacter michiganensis subsp. michiganensis]OUE00880.1 hypothetical protein CMMCAS07_15690 [Clavibacter michiganensis subsp. michiganensis]